MKLKKVYCFFEQSGVFKNEFKKLGIYSVDYDILNDFGETDFIIDLFDEIDKAYNGKYSIFDNINDSDLILAFFPCVRFENQSELLFRGTMSSIQKWDIVKKLEYDLKLHKELDMYYEHITKLAIVCFRRNIPLIIENPYSKTHYLNKYWAIKSKVIDYDRSKRGDYYKKPTQYWFINCEPSNNFVSECYFIQGLHKTISSTRNKVERSLISPEYANRFIKEFII